MREELGPDYEGKPVRHYQLLLRHQDPSDAFQQNDMLSWLMDEAEGEQRTVYALTQRLLTLNFAAIHTSSMVGTLGSLFQVDVKHLISDSFV